MEKADDSGRTLEQNKGVPPQESTRDIKSNGHPILFSGIGDLFLVIFVALFFRGTNKGGQEDIRSLQVRLGDLENRLIAQLEESAQKIALLESQFMNLEESIAELKGSEAPLKSRLDQISQKIDQLEERLVPVAMKTEAPASSQAKNRYHEVRKGETLYGIARTYGISVDKLCRLNQITARTIIRAGQKLLVAD